VAIAAGGYHSLALKSDGTVVAWSTSGAMSNGQAIVPAGLNNVVAVAAGWVHSLALKADGTVVAWAPMRWADDRTRWIKQRRGDRCRLRSFAGVESGWDRGGVGFQFQWAGDCAGGIKQCGGDHCRMA